jgi:hypothetical protein
MDRQSALALQRLLHDQAGGQVRLDGDGLALQVADPSDRAVRDPAVAPGREVDRAYDDEDIVERIVRIWSIRP